MESRERERREQLRAGQGKGRERSVVPSKAERSRAELREAWR